MPSPVALIKELKRELPRQYALWRIGATPEESHCYNTTDRVLLTFDDYGTEANIRSVLSVLAQENIKAAFFLQGDWADRNTALVEMVRAAGHWIGNHTYSHEHLTRMSYEDVRQQMLRGPRAALLRPPYGEYNKHIRAIAHELHFKIAYWTIDSWDWKGLEPQAIHDVVLPRLHQGACILLHLNAPHTLEALPELIAGIRARGYELCYDGTELDV